MAPEFSPGLTFTMELMLPHTTVVPFDCFAYITIINIPCIIILSNLEHLFTQKIVFSNL